MHSYPAKIFKSQPNAAINDEGAVIQKKLAIGVINHSKEAEADTMAGQVMRMPEQPLLQRKCADCEEERLQRKPLTSQTPPFIQTQGESSGHTASTALSNQIASTRGGGNALPESTRNFMESRFAADFSDVRIHTGSDASSMSTALNAQAFTVGRDIYFNEGKYTPDSDTGKRLLAHELTHTLQQGGVQRMIMRTVKDADVETEFQKWAAANKETVNKNSDNYPHQLWTFIATLIMDPTTYGPIQKPPATDKTKLAEWTLNFEKAGIIAKWLIALKSTSQSDTVKDTADARAEGILDFMAQAGLVSNAMAQSGGLSDEKKTILFKTILKNPASASASELETIIAFQCQGVTDPANVPIVKSLTDNNSTSIKQLDAAKTKAVFKALIAVYGSHNRIVEALAQVLLLNPAVRKPISDSMMTSEIGNPELLFKVLKHPFFIEPGYGGQTLTAAIPTGMSGDDYEKKRMKDDMPWVYTYKQKYYVQYLIDLAKGQGIAIPAPASMDFKGLKPWLETNTEKIGEAAQKKYPADPKAVFDIYQNIADIFFFHIPHERDVAPNLEGKISHLVPGEPSKQRFEADCDVFATYAMRLFNSAGFEPIGYIAFVPDGVDAARAAHVGALIRKDGKYYVINNKSILETGISEASPNAEKAAALKKLRKIAFDDAYGDPKPTSLKIFYADAEAKGKMPLLFRNQDSSLERPDLLSALTPAPAPASAPASASASAQARIPQTTALASLASRSVLARFISAIMLLLKSIA